MTQMSISCRVNKRTVAYPYNAMLRRAKRGGILVFVTTRMNLEIMLSEISQTRKVTCYMIPFICHVQNRQIHREREQLLGVREVGVVK